MFQAVQRYYNIALSHFQALVWTIVTWAGEVDRNFMKWNPLSAVADMNPGHRWLGL